MLDFWFLLVLFGGCYKVIGVREMEWYCLFLVSICSCFFWVEILVVCWLLVIDIGFDFGDFLMGLLYKIGLVYLIYFYIIVFFFE